MYVRDDASSRGGGDDDGDGFFAVVIGWDAVLVPARAGGALFCGFRIGGGAALGSDDEGEKVFSGIYYGSLRRDCGCAMN